MRRKGVLHDEKKISPPAVVSIVSLLGAGVIAVVAVSSAGAAASVGSLARIAIDCRNGIDWL